jgi:hypothetical protein
MSEVIWQRAGGVDHPTGLNNFIPNQLPDLDKQNDRLFQLQHGYGHDEAMARLAQQPAMAQLAQKDAHWNALFPYLTQGLRSIGNFSSRVGGQSGVGPRINARPIFDQSGIQQQMNANRAQGAQETAGQVQGMQNRLAGSGFGANSPLAAALQTQMSMANMGNVANQNREFKQNAAQANAGQLLKAQTAQEQQFASRQQEDIERRRQVIGQQQGLLGLLGQFL